MTPNIAGILAKQLADNGPVPLDLPKLRLPQIPAAIQIVAVKHYPVYVEDVVEACIAAQERAAQLEADGVIDVSSRVIDPTMSVDAYLARMNKYAPAIPQ